MKIKEYIESGALESYVFGLASEKEVEELMELKAKHPRVKEALHLLEMDIEVIAQKMAIVPPATIWAKIEDNINEQIVLREATVLTGSPLKNNSPSPKFGQFIELEAESNHIRIHKSWIAIFIAFFILGLSCLIFAVFFQLKSRNKGQEADKIKKEYKNKATR